VRYQEDAVLSELDLQWPKHHVFAAFMLAVWLQKVDHGGLPDRRGHIDWTINFNAAVQQNGAFAGDMCSATKLAIAFANPPLTRQSRHRNVLRSTHGA